MVEARRRTTDMECARLRSRTRVSRRCFGFSPRSARERLRVANELAHLPAFEHALESAVLSYGVVRELTRVATPETETKWLAVARGKNLRQVERLVAGHEKGDLRRRSTRSRAP